MTPTFEAFQKTCESWIAGAKYRNDADVRPLRRAAVNHLKSGGVQRTELAPCLAALVFSLEEFESPWMLRLFVRLWVAGFRLWFYRGRPMWNDFYMGLWMLSRDPRYIGKLHSHLLRANPEQLATGEWMVASVCAQDPDFSEHWADLIGERGPIFDEDIKRYIYQGITPVDPIRGDPTRGRG